MGSGLRAVAPRCLSRDNAGKTISVLANALSVDDFDQAPVSIIYRLWENVQLFICGRRNTGARSINSLGILRKRFVRSH